MKNFIKILLYSFAILSFGSEAVGAQSVITWNGITYNTETVAKLITVITSTSPIKSVPSAKHIYPCQASLFRVPAFALCKKIIVFDGVREADQHLAQGYEQYKDNILELTKTDPYFSNTELVFCSEWRHLTGAVYEAMKHVTTPFIFLNQHDLQILQEFDLDGLIASMVANPKIRCVMLSGGSNGEEGSFNGYHGWIDRNIEGEYFVPLFRCYGWSDQAQIATVDYYQNVVFPQCLVRKGAFMEQTMLHRLRYDVAKLGKDLAHSIYGCYLYGGSFDGPYITHSDGRNN